MIKFHSAAKDLSSRNGFGLPINAPKLLSNFAEIPVSCHGHVYPTAEHAFQASKYLLCSNVPGEEERFRILGDIGSLPPKIAKQHGGRNGMKRVGACLDAKKWDMISESILYEILKSKAGNETVKLILDQCKTHQILLLHHSRSDMKWGCHSDTEGHILRGRNLLGELWMKILEP